MADILVIHGPNLNLLGTREPEVYGYENLTSINDRLMAKAGAAGLTLNAVQSNAEHELIEVVHAAPRQAEQGAPAHLAVGVVGSGVHERLIQLDRGLVADREEMSRARGGRAHEGARVVQSGSDHVHGLRGAGTGAGRHRGGADNGLRVLGGEEPAQVVGGMMVVADTIAGLDYWPNVGPVASRPRLAVICPPALGARADQPDYRFQNDWIGGRDKSLALPALVAAACEQRGLACFDANQAVASSDRDPIHWTREGHASFGAAMADWVAGAGLLGRTDAG